MKTLKNLFLLLLMGVVTVSCDELDELTEFDITEDFNATYTIDVGAQDPNTYTQQQFIDLASNQEIQDNLDLIQDVTLNSLTFEIDNYVGAAGITVTQASLTFANINISVADIDLQQSDIDDTVYTIGDTTQLNAIANALQSNTSITATVTGTVSDVPVMFDVIVTLDVTVTVDVL